MCGPQFLVPAAIAATGAGTVINTIQNNKFQKAQFKAEQERQEIERAAREAERVRQEAIDNQSLDAVRTALTAVAPADRAELVGSEAVGEGDLIIAAADRFDPLPRSTDVSGEVLGDAGKLRDEAARVKQRIAAMSVLSRQGTDQADAVRRLGQLGQQTADLRSKGRRSASVSDFEAAIPAAQVTPSNSILGDLLIAGGQIGAGFGGQALGKSGGSIFGKSDIFKNVAGG